MRVDSCGEDCWSVTIGRGSPLYTVYPGWVGSIEESTEQIDSMLQLLMRRVGQMGIKRRKKKTEITPQSHWNQGRRANSVRKHGPGPFLSASSHYFNLYGTHFNNDMRSISACHLFAGKCQLLFPLNIPCDGSDCWAQSVFVSFSPFSSCTTRQKNEAAGLSCEHRPAVCSWSVWLSAV